jgi:hypothetical protein
MHRHGQVYSVQASSAQLGMRQVGNEILLGLDTPIQGDRALELSLPSEGALLSFEQLRPMTPGALHTGPPILKPRDAIYYSQQRWIWILSARGWCLPRVERTPGDPR